MIYSGIRRVTRQLLLGENSWDNAQEKEEKPLAEIDSGWVAICLIRKWRCLKGAQEWVRREKR